MSQTTPADQIAGAEDVATRPDGAAEVERKKPPLLELRWRR